MPLYEVEWTYGEEIAPGVLAVYAATVEADDLDEVHRKMDDLDHELRQAEKILD